MVRAGKASSVEVRPLGDRRFFEHPSLDRAHAISAVDFHDLSGEEVEVVLVVLVVAPMLLRIEVLVGMRGLDRQLNARLVLVDGPNAITTGSQSEGSQQMVRQMIVKAGLVIEEDVILDSAQRQRPISDQRSFFSVI